MARHSNFKPFNELERGKRAGTNGHGQVPILGQPIQVPVALDRFNRVLRPGDLVFLELTNQILWTVQSVDAVVNPQAPGGRAMQLICVATVPTQLAMNSQAPGIIKIGETVNSEGIRVNPETDDPLIVEEGDAHATPAEDPGMPIGSPILPPGDET